MQFSFDVSDNFSDKMSAVSNELAAAALALSDLTPLMKSIGVYLEGSTEQRFVDKHAPNGVAWANLLPSTQSQKGNNNILVDSGNLVASIGSFADGNSATVGVAEPYGVYHQLGTKDIAARPFLGISDNDITAINDMIDEYWHKHWRSVQ